MKKEVIKEATDKLVEAVSVIAKEALKDLVDNTIEESDKDKKGD